MAEIRGILIDVEEYVFRDIRFDTKIAKDLIGCDMIQFVSLAQNAQLIVDEEGLLKNKARGFKIDGYPLPLMGNAILVGGTDKKGDTLSLNMEYSTDFVSNHVTFVEFDTPPAAEGGFISGLLH